MKAVLIANAETHWTYLFVKEVLIPRGDEICLISISNNKYKDWYEENRIRVITTRSEDKLVDRVKYLRTMHTILQTSRLAKTIDSDYIIVIYPSWILNILFNYSRIRKKIVYYYIGSDLMRVSITKLRMSRLAISNSQNVAFNTVELQDIFCEAYGKWYKGKTHVINFGMSHLNDFDSLSIDTETCRKKYLNDNGKLLVAIAYNANSAQQADEVLARLSRLPFEIKDRIKILLPMQYGADEGDYCHRVKSMAEEIDIETEVINDYYDGNQMAEYIKAVDIFVNSQETDAQAAAVVEHLYAGTIMLNAEWLRYRYLEDLGLFYLTYNSFDYLVDAFCDVIDNYEVYREKAAGNHEKMQNKFTWKKCKEDWDSVLGTYEFDRN